MTESSRRMPLLVRVVGAALALAVFVASPLASAQAGGDETQAEREQRARELFQEGQEHAQAGRMEVAVEKWLAAYEAQPVSLFLFNIAQAYRQLGACSSALYFYQRYLADDLDSQYAEVAEGHARQLASQCEPQSPWTDGTDGGGEPTGGGGEPTGGGGEPTGRGGGGGGEPVDPIEPAPTHGTTQPITPTRFTAFAEVGPAFASMGELEVPVLTSVRAGVAYPLPVGPVELQAGAATSFTPVPWSRSDGESGTALMTGLMANVAARYPVVPKLFARGEFGIGALLFSGVSHENSVFIKPGLSATGALGMFHLRAQVAAEYELTPNLVVSLAPLALSFSPAHAGLRTDSLTRFEVLAGVSVRM